MQAIQECPRHKLLMQVIDKPTCSDAQLNSLLTSKEELVDVKVEGSLG